MRIREATEADAARAAALWTEAYTDGHPREGRRQPYDEGELGRAAAAGTTVLVAESGPGEVIGIAALVPPGAAVAAVARPGEAELARLAVAASARGRGVGRALARRCLELVGGREAAVVLWSRPYQVEAHSLYESLGFRRAPERDERDPEGRRWVFALGPDSRPVARGAAGPPSAAA